MKWYKKGGKFTDGTKIINFVDAEDIAWLAGQVLKKPRNMPGQWKRKRNKQ